MRLPTTLTFDEVTVLRSALDQIDRHMASLAKRVSPEQQADQIASSVDCVRYLLDRAEKRRQVH